jgi:CDP-6-deoxy-D-xylo-4-hexulose-3-dehydrase
VRLAEARALVVGATGLVGSTLMRLLEEEGAEALGTYCSRPAAGLRHLDLRDASGIGGLLDEVQPQVVFVAGGAAGVDRAQLEPTDAWAANADGVQELARAAKTVGARVVLYSTDYIFDGASGPYAEDSVPSPISTYGETKLASEEAVRDAGPDHLIVRTTAVYGWNPTSPNFAMYVWQRIGDGEAVRAPSDQITTPTLADNLVAVTLQLVEEDVTGVVNVVGADRMSRADFARALAGAFALDPGLVVPTLTAELGQAAPRPLEGGLTTDRLRELLDTEPMALDEALKRLRRQWRSSTYVAGGPSKAPSAADELKQEILERTRAYYELAHAKPPFVPGKTRVMYSGRTYGAEEIVNVVDAGLDFWLTLGPYGDLFERRLAEYVGCRHTVLVNSGSSANLTCVMSLMSPLLPRPLVRGDEVITPAVTFPTTLAPIVQCGLIPVFVDCELGTYNVDPDQLERAISPRTRAMFIPHTLGNPFALDVVAELARAHDLYLIEDSCDGLGATYDGQMVGTFGDLASLSFYPAHQITMGEGGAVLVNKARYQRIVRSVRDWGRDCWCAPGESNTCGKRFGWSLGELPDGYDHKYVYSHIGFNLKPTDLQAAIGVAQLDRAPGFVDARRRNFATLYAGLEPYADRLILPVSDPRAEPSWFGFPITVREGVSRQSLVRFLETGNIETRTVFGGNILRQPGYRDIEHRVVGTLDRSDRIMRDTFFIGVHPGLTDEMLAYVIQRFDAFFADGGSRGGA